MRVNFARLKRKTRIKRIHAALTRDIKLSWDCAFQGMNEVDKEKNEKWYLVIPSIPRPMTLGKRYYLIQLVAALEAEEEAYQARINQRRPVVKG